MIDALRLVLSGDIYLPPRLLESRPTRQNDDGVSAQSNAVTKAESSEISASLGLTLRQLDVLSLLCQGMPNKMICHNLEISEGTVKRHVTEILRKLNVSNRTQAVMTAQALGISVAKQLAEKI